MTCALRVSEIYLQLLRLGTLIFHMQGPWGTTPHAVETKAYRATMRWACFATLPNLSLVIVTCKIIVMK